MSEEQLSTLLAKLKEDVGLRERLQGAGDLDAATQLAKAAGFDVTKEDWLKHGSSDAIDLDDDELERLSGGAEFTQGWSSTCYTGCGTHRCCANTQKASWESECTPS